MVVAFGATAPVADRGGVRRLCHRAHPLPRLALDVGLAIFLAYLVPPSILFIPLAVMIFRFGIYDSRLALILTYPTFLIPFCTWLLMGYFRSIPYELEECALVDGASRWQILTRIMLPLAVPGLISAGIFAFTLSWNEFIYALTFIHPPRTRRCRSAFSPSSCAGTSTNGVRSWPARCVGSLPVVLLYSFFVDYYVVVDDGRRERVAMDRLPRFGVDFGERDGQLKPRCTRPTSLTRPSSTRPPMTTRRRS